MPLVFRWKLLKICSRLKEVALPSKIQSKKKEKKKNYLVILACKISKVYSLIYLKDMI